jgi:hypothetical protein
MADDPRTPRAVAIPREPRRAVPLHRCRARVRAPDGRTQGESARCRRVLLEGARRGIQPQQVQVDALLRDMAVVDAFARSRDG